jgi:hypothetical protein
MKYGLDMKKIETLFRWEPKENRPLALVDNAFVVGVRDAEGTMVATSPEAVITKRPEISRAKEAGQNEWIIQGKGEIFEGGNS